jgi:hypothetical protein
MRQILADEGDEEGLPPKKIPRYDLDLSTQSTETSDGFGDVSLHTIDISQSVKPQFPSYQAVTSDCATKPDNNDACQEQHSIAYANPAPSSQASILPSTCSTGDENSQKPGSNGWKQNNPASKAAEPYHPLPNHDPKTPSIIDLTVDDMASPNHTNTQKTESQLTDSCPLSVSESALASPDWKLLENEAQNPEVDGTNLRLSRRARIAAYLAAREDTYSAWTDVSLVSARDNHTEEEIEL